MTSTIFINNQKFSGNSITISGGRIMVDGKNLTPNEKEINIRVLGNLDKITVDSCEQLIIEGDSGSIKTVSGDVSVRGDVYGSIQTISGDVSAKNIDGPVSTVSGDIAR